ncbi:PREDICTED: alpha-latrocrustotoxin-Lt1a-like isoform X4 [Acropora digitifera]|uniref:alpha-latrocrustotoxin-Lt1a-like isoform X4 n=1 Tax=Acropora digitifera TaxID=70779 RepID=UPI00077A4011|nr:PREDICTED: alpha-latrocrustotoxin-Lt1a-like isoform X4 [Acropora digitifera]
MSEDELCQQASAAQISQGQVLNITLLASEWKSIAGGLSTLNRELAINLSQIQNVRVSLLVPEGACNDEDKREARSFGISILDAKKCVGLDPLVWLSNPPQDHKIDVIVGHGVKLGCQVQLIKRHQNFENCKWVHVVHTAPEDLSKYKGYSEPISKGEKKLWDEVDLCKCADLVVPVGPKLRKAYHGYLQESKKDEDFFELIPGLFEREFADLPAKQNPKDERDDFIVLLCGRGDKEDFEVKGYNIAVEAFADQRLKGKHYCLLFVGSPEGKQDEVQERLLNCGIDKRQLTVREFVKSREKMKELFCEVDMVIMPSKSEGFGLVALEALSAGLPILVGSNSGFARAIENIPFGSYSVVDSGNPAKWAECVEGVRVRHKVVLQENKILKEHYSKDYCWKKQCEELVDRLWKMVYGEADRTPLFSRQGGLDPETSMIEKATPGGEEEVLVNQENTDLLTRTEKARASRSALHKASVDGQYEEVKRHLSSGCAVDVKDQFLLTPLHLACWYGQESVVKLLLEHGADVNATDKFQFTPLHKAERCNHESIVKLLLDHKARPTLQQPPSLRTLGRRAFTRTDEHSGFNLLQAAVLEGDHDTVTKASVHLENFVEEMNCRTTGEKASISPGKSAADILSNVKGRMESHPLIGAIYEEFVETEKTLTQLHLCAKSNDVEIAIELVLNDGMDVNVAANRNITPLVWASPATSSMSIKTLIDLGADVNAQTFQESTFGFCSGTALRSAIHGSNANVVKVLLANKADANIADLQGNTVLHSSTSKRFFNVSQVLIDSGSKVNERNNDGETSLHSAVHGKNVPVVKLLLRNNAETNIQDDEGNTPLHISTREGLCDISQLLVDSGCKINVRNNCGETPLHSCVRGENAAAVKLLIKNNADANVQDTWGDTPLHISTRRGLCDISQLLVDSDCKINMRNIGGETPLHSSVRGENAAEVKLLLKNNADANIQDNQGDTPLHTSSRRGFSSISQLLIDSGCNKNLKNRKGKTPLDLKSSPYPSYSPGSYPPCPPYSPDRGDSKEAKANEEHTYAPWKGFRRKSFFESEHKGYPLVRQPTLPTLSSPLLGKPRSGLLLKNRPELSSALRKRRMDYVLSPTLYGDLEEDTGYASQRVLPHKIVFGSEDED